MDDCTAIYRLPWPPSVNGYWRSFKGRQIISKRGREFRSQAVEAIKTQDGRILSGRLSAKIELFPPDRRRRDIDNLLKPLLDALTHGGAIADDELFDQLTITRQSVVSGGEVIVYISTI